MGKVLGSSFSGDTKHAQQASVTVILIKVADDLRNVNIVPYTIFLN